MPGSSQTSLTVLQVIPTLKSGGVERTVIDVARAVVGAGGKALIATAGGRMVAEAEALGARVFLGTYASKNPITIYRNASRLAEITRSEGVNVVHARSRAPAWSAYWAARRCKVAFVTTYHGIYDAGLPGKRFYNSVMARGDITIANSQYTAAHVLKTHHVDPAHLVTIPRGVDIQAFTPSNVAPERVQRLRMQWKVAGDVPVIMLPGRLTRLKGHTTFLDALAKLPHRRFNAVLVGGGEERDHYTVELSQQIEKLGLGDVVWMTGHCDDMPAANLAADIVVSPSTVPESFGRTPVEAQAMGRVVIATALGGQLETVEDGVTGFLVPAFDAAALAAAVERVLAMTPEARAKMAAVGRARVVERYTVDAMCASTLDVYRRVLGRHG